MEAIKDESKEHPIASSWRPIIREVVEAFAKGDFALVQKVDCVNRIPDDIVSANRDYVADYGETLIPLPDETWKTSCALWMDGHWEILVDLFTESEGRSDLVLTGKAIESNGKVQIDIWLIYVP